MSAKKYDVTGIGNAIVDIVATSSSAFLEEQGLPKGAMQLVDDATSSRLYDAMEPATETSGGSAANTIAGLASLGANCAFLGKVRDDELGAVFSHDIRAQGVNFPTAPLKSGAATARCLIFVTPDAQRTMATFLGASVQFGLGDVDEATIKGSAITYLEGYLFDPPLAKQAFRRAVEYAHSAGNRVALSLSDPFCVERHRDDFLQLLKGSIDILFANEAEVTSLLGTADIATIRQRLSRHCPIAVITRSAKGSVVVTAEGVHDIKSTLVGPVLDTTGAGDLYASGFLFGLTRGLDLASCGRLGSLCAAEAISHFGARPQSSLEALAATHGLYPLRP